jgi:hypothetical protein
VNIHKEEFKAGDLRKAGIVESKMMEYTNLPGSNAFLKVVFIQAKEGIIIN